jgi:uncharacterized protein (TIGR02145 family)
MALALSCGLQLIAQESSVKILLNEEEHFRFEGYRFSFINPYSSVYIGDSAGAIGPNSFNNVVIGKLAGYNDTASNYNVYIGTFSGQKTTRGTNNTYIGFASGRESDTAISNTFVGSWSGRFNTSGSINTFIGRRAGNFNTTGSENTFLGQGAGYSNVTGSYNTYAGRFSGNNNQFGNSNVFIGYLAGTNDNSSNRLVISTSDTVPPLVYGEFDTPMLRFNAKWIESGFGGNIFIGDSTGSMHETGDDNIFIGSGAGIYDLDGQYNVFIGQRSGQFNTTGKLNTFVGTGAGWSNTSGLRNTYIGLSTGASSSTGSYNTYIGRIAGYFNEAGDSNVFVGNSAGQYEMGSQKLYISNSETSEPLIYGDFADKKLKFHADSVWATGEIRADGRFNVGGLPGITDTLNTVTSISFTQNKLKYRTTIITGGIITFMSPESEWSDTIEEYLIPCNAIGLMGEFNGGTDDLPMTRTSYNPYLWMLSVKFTIEDDLTEPADSIVEVKFRDNASWTVNWGSTDFPTGTGYQDGPYIPVPLCDYQDTTYYCIQFNCLTGEYSFEELTGLCGDPLIDLRDGKRYATVLIGEQCWMAQNLNVGTRINGGTDQTDNETIEKYCYNNDEANCTRWGGLYQWLELMDYVTTEGTRGICPDGFHVPTDEEFKILEGNVDSQYGPGSPEWDKTGFRGYDAGYNLRSVEGWSGSDNGSDAFGFHAVPGGYYVSYGETPGFFDSGCCNTYFTSSLDEPSNMSYVRHMNKDVGKTISRNTGSTTNGNSLRCLKD